MSKKKIPLKTENGTLYRQCTKCKEWSPSTNEFFVANGRSPDGLSCLCKKCKKIESRAHYEKVRADPVKWQKTLERNREEKRRNHVRTRNGWTEYNNRPEVKERKAAWHKVHCCVAALTDEQYKKKMLQGAKTRAIAKGWEFNLTLDDIIIPEVCPILETKLTRGDHKRWESPENTISLDRIDPTKGYVKGNVRVISTLANTMKNNATFDQLRAFAKNITKYIDGEDIVQTSANTKALELQDKEPVS